MRISEKMGLVYTALFLTVSIALITQNEDRLMAAFRGESAARAVDDIFTVQTGRTQRLDVLANDLYTDEVTPADIRLLKTPACGSVRQVGGAFDYTAPETCTGYQAFSYCIDTGRKCPSANVALRLIKARAPKASVGDQAISSAPQLNGRVGVASGDLEISNIRLGKGTNAESRPALGTAGKLAQVAIEAAPSLRQPALSTGQMGATPPSVSVLSTRLPTGTSNTDRAPLLREASAGPVGSLAAGRDSPLARPPVPVATDINARGQTVACAATLSARAEPQAMVALTINDSCQPGARVVIQHGRLRFAARLGADGRLVLRVPALERVAHFRITLPKGQTARATVEVPDIGRYDRIAFIWRGRFDIRPANVGTAGNGIGHPVHLGDPALKNPMQAMVYTAILKDRPNRPLTDLALSVTTDSNSCGKGAVLQSLHANGGRIISASGLRFRLPRCDSGNDTLVLKNVARDLIIASR